MLQRPLLIAASALLGASVASATDFHDEASWQAAAGTFQSESFESISNLQPVTRLPSVDLYMNRLVTLMAAPTVMAVSTTGGNAHSGSNVLVNQGQPVLPGLGPIRLFSTKPGFAIRGMGYWNTGGDDSTVIRFYDVNGALIESSDTNTSVAVFNGIITDQVVGWVEIDAGSLGNGYITIDDLQVTFTAIPDSIVLPQPDLAPLAMLKPPATSVEAACNGGACLVSLNAPPQAVGVVRVLAVDVLPSPLKALGLFANSPLSQTLATVQADASGHAAIKVKQASLQSALSAQEAHFVLQVDWMVPTAKGPKLVHGAPIALPFQ